MLLTHHTPTHPLTLTHPPTHLPLTIKQEPVNNITPR